MCGKRGLEIHNSIRVKNYLFLHPLNLFMLEFFFSRLFNV